MCPPDDLQPVRINRQEAFRVPQASVAQDLTLRSLSSVLGVFRALLCREPDSWAMTRVKLASAGWFRKHTVDTTDELCSRHMRMKVTSGDTQLQP